MSFVFQPRSLLHFPIPRCHLCPRPLGPASPQALAIFPSAWIRPGPRLQPCLWLPPPAGKPRHCPLEREKKPGRSSSRGEGGGSSSEQDGAGPRMDRYRETNIRSRPSSSPGLQQSPLYFRLPAILLKLGPPFCSSLFPFSIPMWTRHAKAVKRCFFFFNPHHLTSEDEQDMFHASRRGPRYDAGMQRTTPRPSSLFRQPCRRHSSMATTRCPSLLQRQRRPRLLLGKNAFQRPALVGPRCCSFGSGSYHMAHVTSTSFALPLLLPTSSRRPAETSSDPLSTLALSCRLPVFCFIRAAHPSMRRTTVGDDVCSGCQPLAAAAAARLAPPRLTPGLPLSASPATTISQPS